MLPTYQQLLIRNSAGLAELIPLLWSASIVAVDCETIGIDPRKRNSGTHGELFCWTLSFRVDDVVYGVWLPGPAYAPELGRSCLNALAPWAQSNLCAKVGHNWFGFDGNIFARAGVKFNGVAFDTMAYSRTLPQPANAKHGLKHLSKELLGYEFGSFENLFSRRLPLPKPLVIKPKLNKAGLEVDQYTRRKIDGAFVKTLLIPGEYHALGKAKKPKRALIPLDEWVALYPDKMDVLVQYSTLDAVFTLLLYEHLDRTARETLTHKNETFRSTYIKYIHGKEQFLQDVAYNGIAFDEEMNEVARAKQQAHVDTVRPAFESKYCPTSGKGLTSYLYDHLKLTPPLFCGSGQAVKRNYEAKRVVDAVGCENLAKAYPEHADLFYDLLKVKKAVKLLEFLSALPKYCHNGRIHASLSARTETGRLSCTKPNLQQIPKSDSTGIRRAFISAPGKRLVIADYSQMEMVVLAHICISLFDKHTLANALEASDFHARTAQLCWPNDYDSDPKYYRKCAKTVNYGVSYGKGVHGLAAQLGISADAAQQILTDYYDAFPEVLQYKHYMQNCARKNGWVPMIDGRRRLLPEAQFTGLHDPYIKAIHNGGLRKALNTPIQGSAAAIVNMAMAGVVRCSTLASLGAMPVLQIHDEIILEAPEANADAAKEQLVKIMTTALPLRATLHVDARTALTWWEG